MTHGKSSSNREGGVSDAVLWKDRRAVGPMRLPQSRAEDFVFDFNRIYRGIGIVLNALETDSAKKIPDNAGVAGDSDLDG